MKVYHHFVTTLVKNYIIGSLISVLGVGGLFVFYTFDLTSHDALILFSILFSSLIIMCVVELIQFNKDLSKIKLAFKKDHPSLDLLEEGFMTAHRFPAMTIKRILIHHWLGITIPAVSMTAMAIHFEVFETNIPYYYIILATVGSFLVANMHAVIEFFLTTKAIQPITVSIAKLSQEYYQKQLSLNGKVLMSMKRKFLFSTIFIGIFPLLLYSLASYVRLEHSQGSNSLFYWQWAIVILLFAISFAVYAAFLLFKEIEQPLVQLQRDMKTLQDGELIKTDELYSDEFSKLTSGFNHMVKAIDKRDHLNQNLSESLITILAAALDTRDSYTSGHSHRVAKYSVAIAEQYGMTSKDIINLRKSALLHDIGKIGVNDSILLKEGKLTDAEFEQIKQHPIYGYNILSQVNPIDNILPLLDGVKYHHERYDGKGYPEGLSGKNIPLFGRIMAVADAFDAMTSNRPYRRGFSFEKALAILREGSGTQWDPVFANIFINYIEKTQEKSIQQMKKERAGI